MLMPSVLSGAAQRLAPWLAGGRPAGGAGSAGAPKGAAPPPRASSSAKADALRTLAAHYDVTRITPREFSELVQRLRKADVLTETDLQELAGIRVDLEQAGLSADEEVDLVDFYRRRLEQLEAETKADPTANRAQLDRYRRRLDWVTRLALMHREPEASALV